MPAVRLCLIVVLGHVAIVQSGLLLHGSTPYLAGGFLVLAIVLAARRSWSAVRACGCLAVALMLAARVVSEYVPAADGFDAEKKARIEGYVTRVLSVRERAVRLMIEGEVDCERLPAIRTRVLLTLFHDNSTSLPTNGCRLVVFARVRRPDPASLPDEFDEQSMCRSMHVSFVGTADMRDVDIRAQPHFTYAAVCNTQYAITSTLHAHVADDVASVLSAVIIGDESELEHDVRRAYAQSGTAHMFSVSGSHVSILLALGLVITVAIRRHWLRALLLLILIVGYVIVSGGSAPAWRAAIMGLLALWGRNTERDVLGLNVLAVAILCMTILDPSLPWSTGFQLSVSATAAILMLTPRWNSLLERCTIRDSSSKRFLRLSCAVTLAASAGISLPSALIFGQVALWSPIANLVVVPILSIAMVAGSGLVLVHYAAPWLAPSLAWVCSNLVHAADGVVWLFAGLQPNSVSTAHVMCHSVLSLGLCVWPLVATSWTGLLIRQAACVTMMVCVLLVPSPPPAVIQEYTRRTGNLVVVRKPQRTVVLTSLRNRDAAVERYVKSLHGKVNVIHRGR